jgi:Arc/MetJ-type ribon-helix-helix transcriptional regulator
MRYLTRENSLQNTPLKHNQEEREGSVYHCRPSESSLVRRYPAWQASSGMLASRAREIYGMTIKLPDDLERFIRAEVRSGHFASEEDAIAEAVRLLKRQLIQAATTTPAAGAPAAATTPDPVLGAMRDAADEMDEIVAEAMTHREQQPWRLPPSE